MTQLGDGEPGDLVGRFKYGPGLLKFSGNILSHADFLRSLAGE
jgi:hypothetical protein